MFQRDGQDMALLAHAAGAKLLVQPGRDVHNPAKTDPENSEASFALLWANQGEVESKKTTVQFSDDVTLTSEGSDHPAANDETKDLIQTTTEVQIQPVMSAPNWNLSIGMRDQQIATSAAEKDGLTLQCKASIDTKAALVGTPFEAKESVPQARSATLPLLTAPGHAISTDAISIPNPRPTDGTLEWSSTRVEMALAAPVSQSADLPNAPRAIVENPLIVRPNIGESASKLRSETDQSIGLQSTSSPSFELANSLPANLARTHPIDDKNRSSFDPPSSPLQRLISTQTSTQFDPDLEKSQQIMGYHPNGSQIAATAVVSKSTPRIGLTDAMKNPSGMPVSVPATPIPTGVSDLGHLPETSGHTAPVTPKFDRAIVSTSPVPQTPRITTAIPSLQPGLFSDTAVVDPLPTSLLNSFEADSVGVINNALLAPTTATAQVTASMTPTRVYAPQVAAQIATAVVHSGGGTTEIALNPEELGRVRMTLTTTEAGLTVAIIAERPETADLMRKNINLLLREFQDLGHSNLSFSFEDQSADSDPSETDHRTPPTGSDDTVIIDQPVLTQLTTASSGGLDLKL